MIPKVTLFIGIVNRKIRKSLSILSKTTKKASKKTHNFKDYAFLFIYKNIRKSILPTILLLSKPPVPALPFLEQ